MKVMIRGAGDIATGIALRLYRCGIKVILTEVERPLSVRRTVCFSEAVRYGEYTVEGVKAVLVSDQSEAELAWSEGNVPVIVDPDTKSKSWVRPYALVDAILAKRNIGTHIDDAEVVIGVGPGFCAGSDCHAVIESKRGHTLGRVIHEGSALPNTGSPGNIAGYTEERIIRSPEAGIFLSQAEIGQHVEAHQQVGTVGGQPVLTSIGGMLRGLIADGTYVTKGLKCGDVDPRDKDDYCGLVSDKALAIGGGVLEAILYYSQSRKEGVKSAEVFSNDLWEKKNKTERRTLYMNLKAECLS